MRRAILIGAGVRGAQWHGALEAHEQWDVAGVVDVDLAAAGRVANGHAVAASIDGIDTTNVDAAVVVTPVDRHVDPVSAALDAGLAVLVEKPLATDLAQAVALRDRADAGGRPLVVAQNYRYLRFVEAMRRVLASRAIGTPTHASITYDRPWDDVDAHVRAREDSVLWEMAPHHLDLVRFVFDTEVTDVAATLESLDSARPRGATLDALLGTERGIRVTYHASYEASGPRRIEGGRRFSMRVTGTKGNLYVLQRWLVLHVDGRPPRPVRRGKRDRTEESRLLDDLGAAIDGRPAPTRAEDNVRTLAVVEACRRAATEGRTVAPDELLRAARG